MVRQLLSRLLNDSLPLEYKSQLSQKSLNTKRRAPCLFNILAALTLAAPAANAPLAVLKGRGTKKPAC